MLDSGKLANNLIKLSQNILGNTLFLQSTKIARNPAFTGSIYGCQGGLTGGYFGGYYSGIPMPPPANIFHPYYNQGQTYAPLIEQGIAYGTEQVSNNILQRYEQIKGRQTAGIRERMDAEADPETQNNFMKALKENKAFGFVTEAWTKLNEKISGLTEEEKSQLGNAYYESLSGLSNSLVKSFDKDNDKSVNLEEFKAKLLESKPDATEEEKAELSKKAELAFNRLDTTKQKSLNFVDMMALITYMDLKNNEADGKIESDVIATTKEKLFATEDNISEELSASRKNLI